MVTLLWLPEGFSKYPQQLRRATGPFLGQDTALRSEVRSGARRCSALSPVLSGQSSLHFGRVEKTEAVREWDDGPDGVWPAGLWAVLNHSPEARKPEVPTDQKNAPPSQPSALSYPRKMDTGPNPSGHPKLTLALSRQGMMIPQFEGGRARTLTLTFSS